MITKRDLIQHLAIEVDSSLFWEETPQGHGYWANVFEHLNAIADNSNRTQDEELPRESRSAELLRAGNFGNNYKAAVLNILMRDGYPTPPGVMTWADLYSQWMGALNRAERQERRIRIGASPKLIGLYEE